MRSLLLLLPLLTLSGSQVRIPGPGGASAVAATLALVHAGGCTVANGGTTCSLTWPSAMATGNYDIFACVVPNSAQNPVTAITSVNAGGTLETLVGASTGSYGSSGAVNMEQSVRQIRPATSTGTAGTTVTITLNQAATSAGGSCYAAEYHPSANGSLVATDIDGSYQPVAAAANLTNINVTASGTSDVSFKMFMNTNGFVTPTAVNAPYNTNFFTTGATASGAFSTGTGCGTGETWTNGSVFAVMATVCVGFSPTTPLVASVIDWSGVTNGSQVTAAQMMNSTHGWKGGTPVFSGTMTGSNVAAVQLNATSQRLAGDGGTYTGNTGLSVAETGTGAAAVNYVSHKIAQGLPNTTGMSYWFCSTRLATDANAQDIGANSNGGGTNFNGTGTTLFFKLEGGTSSTSTINYTTDASGSCAAGHLGNWVNIQNIGPITTSGTVNTSGTAVTLASGASFDTHWTGVIVINGSNFTIASVNSTTSITLTATAGTLTGVSYNTAQDYMAVYQCASGGPPGCTLNQVGSTLATSAGAFQAGLQNFVLGHLSSQPLATGKINFYGPAYIFLGPLTSSSFPLPD